MIVTIFTGGSGNANLISYLSSNLSINLNLVLNGYDDGKSTGLIRQIFDDMLGPSDFRKNFSRVLDTDYHDTAVKDLFEKRLKQDDISSLQADINKYIDLLTYEINVWNDKTFLKKYLHIGFKAVVEKISNEKLLDFSVGNIIFGGMFHELRNFNKVLENLVFQFSLKSRIFNITSEDTCNIIGVTQEGEILWNEEDIVNFSGDRPLADFKLINRKNLSQYKNSLNELSENIPDLDYQVLKAINESQIIVFGSGTLFSSLLPTYRILKNKLNSFKGFKVLLINNKYDNDIKNISLSSYIELHTRELNVNYSYFDLILIDINSEITIDVELSNLVKGKFSLQDFSHNAIAIWNEILKHFQNKKNCRVTLISSEKAYEHEFRRLFGNRYTPYSDNLTDEDVVFIIETDGKFRIDNRFHDIYNMLVQYEYDIIIGNRFPSRKHLLKSLSLKSEESRLALLKSQIFSLVVSFLFLIRYGQYHLDPYSGIIVSRKKLISDIANKNYFTIYREVLHKKYDTYSYNINFLRSKKTEVYIKKILGLIKILR